MQRSFYPFHIAPPVVLFVNYFDDPPSHLLGVFKEYFL